MRDWSESQGKGWAVRIRTAWLGFGVWPLGIAVVMMAVAAVHRLRNETWRLLYETGPSGAIDLVFHHAVVRLWFAGEPVYGSVGTAYPPASFVFLWPFTGWLDVEAARWFWAITTVAALAWLIRLLIQSSGASSRLERLFIALIPLSMYATSATIGNGQFILHLFPPMLAGLLIVGRRQDDWRSDLLAASFVLFALVKPTVAAPFFWIVMFVPGRWRPAALVVVGYLAVSLFAGSFQLSSFLDIQKDWARNGAIGTSVGGANGGFANLSTWLTRMGWGSWNVPVALFVLAGLGVWTHRHRRCDLWILIGVAALVSRLWIYHRLYDDVLILLPMIALFRLANVGSDSDGRGVMAGVLLAVTWAGSLAPAHFLVSPPPLNILFEVGQSVIWIGVLIYLILLAKHESAEWSEG
jgi:hypothetical protein